MRRQEPERILDVPGSGPANSDVNATKLQPILYPQQIILRLSLCFALYVFVVPEVELAPQARPSPGHLSV